MDATEQAGLVASGQVTAAELLDAAIERITDLDPALNAVVMRWFDGARALASGPPPGGPFRGVPFLLKDFLVSYAGRPLSDGNVRLKEKAAPASVDAAVVTRFRAAGLVTAGRTNSAEFGSLPTTEPLAWGPTRNPWHLDRSAGGSSGGSAAAVASGMVAVAHASDGGGSIRIPASWCGLVGLKPTQGRVSLGPYGDESGPGVHFCHARSVRDVAAMLDAVSGPGVGDTVIAPPPARPYMRELAADPGPLRIGLLDHYPWGEAVHEDCATAARAAGRLLEALGHRVEHGFPAALADRTLGRDMGVLRAVGIGVMADRLAEALGRSLTPADLEPVNWALVEQARDVGAVRYARALESRTLLRRAVQQWWADGFDLLLTPTTGEPPAELGTFAGNSTDLTALATRSRRCVAFTQPFNVSGQPAISLPLHWSPDALPIGVQLAAAYGREDLLLRVAHQLEQLHPWTPHHPTATS
ncbi:amidase [Actinomadura gamaensis]|uniref:Amidase n=1 Tax=Actinomadura gamaensis TaxID=1763541 RepID=A0ABV9TU34_9ACTN